VTILVAILAPLAAQLLYFAVSRKREYLADASAARFTRYPAGLASALEKIAGHQGKNTKGVLRAVAPMYIVNPLQAASGTVGLFSTHPPTAERIRILRSMGGAAGWADYDNAFKRVVGGGATGVLDQRTLQSEGSVAARGPTAEPETREKAVERARAVTDLLDRFAGLLLVACPCGVQIKIPPELRREQVACPRCGRAHEVPHAETAEGADEAGTAPLRYRRKGTGWESFKCSCGAAQQISPAFSGSSKTCGRCGRKIEILDT
jgi:heat shock protein HtpX